MSIVIYVANPYSGPTKQIMEARYFGALTYTGYLLKRGLIPYSPIVHFHDLAKRTELPTEFEFWTKINFAMLDRCDALHVLCWVGWHNSVGVKAEIEYAQQIGKPVTYVREGKDGYQNSKRAPK